MAIFENMFGTQPDRREYKPKVFRPKPFRKPDRIERNDPAAMRAYEEEKKAYEEDMQASIADTKKRYGKDWRKKPQQVLAMQEKKISEQRATRKAEVEKAAEDMRSGKKSSFVGKAYREGRDPYAGVEGPLPMYRTPEEAEAAGQARYISPEQEQYMPAQAYVGKSEQERSAMETSGEYPEVGRFKPTEGRGVEVRRAIPQQRVFKAMIEGKPEESQVFDSKKEADKYLQNEYSQRVGILQTAWREATDRGDAATAKKLESQIKTQRMGVVASVRGTPEEMARYKEESKAGEREKERLSKLYKQRQEEAQGRVAKAREAMQAYDEATTPAQKESARAGIEAARLESAMAQSTRGMSEEQRKKFAEGLGGVLERRKTREREWEKRTEKARAESRAQQATASEERAINNQLKFYNQQLGTLRRAYNQASRNRDEGALFEIGQAIDAWSAGVPEDPKQQRDAARRGILREKFEQLERERRRREELARTNPDAAR